MRFGIVGAGRIGGGLALQAVDKGHQVVCYTLDRQRLQELAGEGVEPAADLTDLVGRLAPPRIVVLYLPQGQPVDDTVAALLDLLDPTDVVVDGGNSHWEDSRRRHELLATRGIHLLDMGTSGGLVGARHGACFMVGGDEDAFHRVEPLLADLAADRAAVIHAGPSGSGHFVKMVHNAIEFGMLQAIGEGVGLLVRSDYDLDLPALLDTWTHGSVIRSWLVELMAEALRDRPRALEELSTCVDDTGEVKWIIQWALARDVPTPVVALSQHLLMQYRDEHREPATPMAKAVALMRHGFGGHPLHPRDDA
jgi:6-phosphogluconate dehydrogenase